MKEISQQVVLLRKKAGLTQKELADFAGVGKTVVFDVEKGKDSVRFCTLLKIFKLLNISIVLQSPVQEATK